MGVNKNQRNKKKTNRWQEWQTVNHNLKNLAVSFFFFYANFELRVVWVSVEWILSIYFLITVSPPNHPLRHENTEYDHQLEKLLIVKKTQFSMSVPQEIYREQFGEYVYWCYWCKGVSTTEEANCKR